MKPNNQPNVKLKGIEYLLLAIQSDPGNSQRHYLRRLHQYQHGKPDHYKGGTNNGYFTSESYRDVLWEDLSSEKKVKYNCFKSINSVRLWQSSEPHAYKTSRSKLFLTESGWERANNIRQKLGLERLPLRELYRSIKTRANE